MPTNKGPLHAPSNTPWGLTVAEAQTIGEVLDLGDYKRVSLKTGVPVRTIEQRMKRCHDKIPGDNRLQKLLTFYRWLREGETL